MRARSKKTARIYVQRRKLVAALLEARPICERCRFDRATDVHEVKSRARGGSILDEANCRALCRPCHDFITIHPRQAITEGLSVHSWDEPGGAA